MINLLSGKVEHSFRQKCYTVFKINYMIHTFKGANFSMYKRSRPGL
jgi:hypothetical protein